MKQFSEVLEYAKQIAGTLESKVRVDQTPVNDTIKESETFWIV